MKLINAEDVLSHRFIGVDDADRILRKSITDNEIYAYRLGWNSALEVVADVEKVNPNDLIKHGAWQRGKKKYWNYSCSECGCEISWQAPYCPQCGCKMEKMTEENKMRGRVLEKTDSTSNDVLEEIRIG